MRLSPRTTPDSDHGVHWQFEDAFVGEVGGGEEVGAPQVAVAFHFGKVVASW